MPCQSYNDDWNSGDDDRKKIRELKKQADMLARIACKALTELEKNEVEDLLLLQDDEVRTWWQKHKEDDAREQARVAEIERKQRVKEEALARLSDEEKELLGLAQPKKSVATSSVSAKKSPGRASPGKLITLDIEKMLDSYTKEYQRWEDDNKE
jgi:hypothetical protein